MGIYLEKQVLFIFLIPIWMIVRIILIYLSKKSRSKLFWGREISLSIFFIYILCVLSVTLFPLLIQFTNKSNEISINLIPIVDTAKEVANITSDASMHNFMIKFWIKNIFGNILLLFPLGIMLPMLWKKFNSLSKTILFAFCLSLSIETLQLLSGYIGNVGRAFDIDDILLNTIGAFIGFIVYNSGIKIGKIKLPLNKGQLY